MWTLISVELGTPFMDLIVDCEMMQIASMNQQEEIVSAKKQGVVDGFYEKLGLGQSL
jgi:hypothetical protein